MAPLVTGLHMTVCSFELAIYYAHQQCPLCCHPGVEECVVQGIPLIWNQGNLSVTKQILEPYRFLDPAVVLTEKAQATSIILLLGVGSFICYKIFHHFRHKLKKQQRFNSKLLKKLELSQWISNELITKDISPDVECIEEKYFGPDNLGDSDNQSPISDFPQFSDTEEYTSTWEDKESASDSQYLSDSDKIMGTSASNQSIPVFYNKTNGVFFNNLPTSSQHEDVHSFQNMENPLHDPCSSSPLPFSPVTFESLKPKSSPRRNIHLVNQQNDLNMPRPRISPDKSIDFSFGYFESSHQNQQPLEDNAMHETSSHSLWDFQFQDQDSLSLSYDLFSCDDNAHSQDTGSLKAAFSPGSLKERYFKAQPFFLCLEKSSDVLQNKHFSTENSLDLGVSSEYHSQHIKRENSSNDSICSFSDNLFVRNVHPKQLAQYDCSDSETCESCLDIQSEVADLNCHTVDQIEKLENQLHEVKQAVLEIDAGIVELKVYETPPKNSWNITAISPDVEHTSWTGNTKNDINDISHQKMNVCCKQLINTIFSSEKDSNINSGNCNTCTCKHALTNNSDLPVYSHCTEHLKVPPGESAIPFCSSAYVFSKSLSDKQNLEVLDSGSDFGTDFEEISENEEPCSLEWDPMCLPECSNKSEDNQVEELPATDADNLKKSLTNNKYSSNDIIRVPKRKRSLSFPSVFFKGQNHNDASGSSKKKIFYRRMTFPICNSDTRTNTEQFLELSKLYRFSEINHSNTACARLSVENQFSYPVVNYPNNSNLDLLQKEKEECVGDLKAIISYKLEQEKEFDDSLESCNCKTTAHICQLCSADNNGNCLETTRHCVSNYIVEENISKEWLSYKENNILDNEPYAIDNSLTISDIEVNSCTDSQIKSSNQKCND